MKSALANEKVGDAAHERPDGFEVSVSRTLAVSGEALIQAWKDPGTRKRWLPKAPLSITKSTPGRSLRAKWGEGEERLDVSVYPKGEKTLLTVQHRRLPDPEAAERSRAFWRERLQRLSAVLEAPPQGKG